MKTFAALVIIAVYMLCGQIIPAREITPERIALFAAGMMIFKLLRERRSIILQASTDAAQDAAQPAAQIAAQDAAQPATQTDTHRAAQDAAQDAVQNAVQQDAPQWPFKGNNRFAGLNVLLVGEIPGYTRERVA